MSGALNTNGDLSNLSKWQAFSHPDLANCRPESLFEADFVEPYCRLHQDLWWRITRLHDTLYTLDKLDQFPFDYVYGPNGMEFWRLVVGNFLDAAILLLDGLVRDKGKDVHSLRSFHNHIITGPWLCGEKCALLKRTLQERTFDKECDSIADRVHEIRNNRVAHRLMDRGSGSPKEAFAGVSLAELRQLFDATQLLFGALSFGSAFVTLAGDLMPGTVGGQPTRSCLDEVLDAVLRDSCFVKQPECKAHWWPSLREAMDPEALRIMNDLRKRIGLREA